MFISKRKNGYYYLFINDESTGKRKMITCKTKKKSEAFRFLKNLDKSLTNKSIDNSLVNIKQLQLEVMKYVTDNLRYSTTLIYKRVFKDLLRIIGNKHLKLLTARDIEVYKSKRLQEVSPSTVNIDLTTIKAIFNIGIRFNWLITNPANLVKKIKIAEKERLCFNDSEINLILSNIDKLLHYVVLFALNTGCRINEILNIQLSDINFNSCELLIRNKKGFLTKTGKNRIIPISDNLSLLIKEILEIRNNVIPLNNPESYLFNKNGYKLNADYVSKSFKKCLRRLNLPERFHFHCLRHTYITNLIKAGVNINSVKLLAGHAVIKTTENYIHVDISDLRAKLNLLAK